MQQILIQLTAQRPRQQQLRIFSWLGLRFEFKNQGQQTKTIFQSLFKINENALFLDSKNLVMDVASWWPFFVVIGLFILAIVSPWIFPNKMVSKNRHDNKF